MAEVVFRFPGELAYTYFEVKGTPEELVSMNYEMLAALYVNAQKGVLVGSIQAKQAITAEPAPAEASAEELPTNSTQSDSEAVSALSEGLDGVTEIADVNAPPWKKPVEAKKPQVWEAKKPEPEVSSGNWDF